MALYFFQYFVGYFYGIMIAHFCISCIIKQLWKSIPDQPKKNRWLAGIVGWIERALFIIAILNCAYGFIGIWLILKAAAQWRRYSDTQSKGKIASNIFIIGSGLSVIFAIVGAKLIDWLKEDVEISKIVIIPLIVILFSLLIKLYIEKQQDRDKKNTKII